MKYDSTIREEELKNRVAADFFPSYDCVNILGNVDFSVCVKDSTPSLFDNDFLVWGEAKRGTIKDFKTSFVQLILTVGKERTFDKYLPPRFLCEFDSRQIAFIPYDKVLEVFYVNDFNWNVTPSDHSTKEFTELYGLVDAVLDKNTLIYDFDKDETQLRSFIRENMKISGGGVSKTRITKNNFISIYNRWLDEVKPSIQVNWNTLKPTGIIEADFFLADIMSKENKPIMEKLQVLLLNDRYRLDRKIDEFGLFTSREAQFSDNGTSHERFWLKYVRPPKKEYQDYILNRRDLLVPQDIRERRGSYFTPRKWVELAQRYLADTLGENWQDEYYIWDCCGGTGNLEIGLTNKYNVYVSTLDQSDVNVMHERIEKGANLLPDHVFQFDFLNDGYCITRHGLIDDLCNCEKLPKTLRDVIRNIPEKLVWLINPPYAEASDVKTTKGGVAKKAVEKTKANELYAPILRQANAELFAQFLTRMYIVSPGSHIAEFSTIKHLQGPHFKEFRDFFKARLVSMFLVPANTFDNVNGQFPIGFHIWDTGIKERFNQIQSNVYDRDGAFFCKKQVETYDNKKYINDWIKPYRGKRGESFIGKFPFKGNDFQNQNMIQIVHPQMVYSKAAGQFMITRHNLLKASIYFAARKIPAATWLNDRDQFLAPSDYSNDPYFATDCLAYTLFSNNIQSKYGPNDWIPFSETEVGAQERFTSHFMYDYIHGKLPESENEMFSGYEPGSISISFSEEATNVLDAGRELWKYYHSSPKVNPEASLYDIRAYFQGFKQDGKMNAESSDIEYTRLIRNLRNVLRTLADKIEPKIYEYKFLKR